MRRIAWMAAAALAAACGPDDEPGSDCGPSSALVVAVTDGDTIEIEGGVKIRYLLVDTPESTTKVECYGPEAKAYNSGLVKDQVVELKYGTECKDRYGRLLAFVSVNGREVNSLLVEKGFADVMYFAETGNGKDRVEEFYDLRDEAKDAGRGMWGACVDD